MPPRRLPALLIIAACSAAGCVQEIDVLGSSPDVSGVSGASLSSSGQPDPGSSSTSSTGSATGEAEASETGDSEAGATTDVSSDCADVASFCPSPGATLHVQLSGSVDPELDVDVYVVDLFEAEDATLARLAERGVSRVCWLGAGNWEPWRPDAGDFPEATLGSAIEEFEDERWIDVRSAAVRGVISNRFDLASARGCEAVLATNTDAYRTANGLGLTAADALDYHAWLADQAHTRGISIGLGSDLPHAAALRETYDWAYDVGCFETDACEPLSGFIDDGAAVFSIELVDDTAQGPTRLADICPTASSLGFSTQVKQPDFGPWSLPC